VDYTILSLAEARTALDDITRETQETFGGLDVDQLNWRPDATRWSVGQCFEHLFTANRLMVAAAQDALNELRPRTVWQRLPVVPRILGTMMIRSQAPTGTRRFTAPVQAQPSSSTLPVDTIQRFIDHHRDVTRWVQLLDERAAAHAIMTSPFVRVVTYSVLDGIRLLAAHDRRHFEQARRVMSSPGFPRA